MVFVNGDVRWISGAQWQSFLNGQKKLLDARTEREKNGVPLVTMQVEMPDGTVVTNSDSTCDWEIKSENLSIGVSGDKFDPSRIALYRAPIQSGEVHLHLRLAGQHAEGKVRFRDGEPDRTNVVLRLGN